MFKHNKLAAVAMVALMAAQGSVFAADAADPVVAKVGESEIHQSELDMAIGGLDPQLAQLPEEQKRVAALSAVIDMQAACRMARTRKVSRKTKLQEARRSS